MFAEEFEISVLKAIKRICDLSGVAFGLFLGAKYLSSEEARKLKPLMIRYLTKDLRLTRRDVANIFAYKHRGHSSLAYYEKKAEKLLEEPKYREIYRLIDRIFKEELSKIGDMLNKKKEAAYESHQDK